MWKCPKCGRTFKNTNQEHYCGEAPSTIEEYIKRQPEQAQHDKSLEARKKELRKILNTRKKELSPMT